MSYKHTTPLKTVDFEVRREEIDAQFDRSDALIELCSKTISKIEETNQKAKDRKWVIKKSY